MPLSIAGTVQALESQPRAAVAGGFTVVAQLLREAAASDLSSSDVQRRLAGAISDKHQYNAGYVDHFGDHESGDVVYSTGDKLKKAPYSIGDGTTIVDFDSAADVQPRTSYEEQEDEDGHYAKMQESFRAQKLYTELPVYERFIAKGERDEADAGDFAGKNRSFPILKPGDVQAAFHALGRAGSDNYSTAVIRATIIKIAKRKGWSSSLPKSEKNGAKESRTPEQTALFDSGIRLVESAVTLDTIRLQEARADYEIKLIAPGRGSSAVYPKEVLKRDGPKVFKAGTHVYLNHPTAAEEAARPEGDVANLAGVLTTAATYYESHAKGEGLYARMKVFADHAQMVEEKAAHVGMSIRAFGNAEAKRTEGGLPVLKELTAADSVDVVTRAGAGGMILTEAARAANPNRGGDMTEAEVKRLIESAQEAERAKTARLRLAFTEAGRILSTMSLPEAAKRKIVESVTGGELPVTAAGALDIPKLTESVNKAARTEGEYLAAATGSGRVFGMGAGPSLSEAGKNCPDCDGTGKDGNGDCDTCNGSGKVAKESLRNEREDKRLREAAVDVFADLMGGDRKAAQAAVNRRVA